jgi:nitroreductase
MDAHDKEDTFDLDLGDEAEVTSETVNPVAGAQPQRSANQGAAGGGASGKATPVAPAAPGGNLPNGRAVEAEVDPRFPDRWSPRAFTGEALTETQVGALLEAVRWAPSAYNEQPWNLVYSVGGEGLEVLRELLVDGNRLWADRAPFLAFFLAKRHFAQNGRENPTALFDCGAAWMSLALQARALGLYAHGMSGFHKDKAFEVLDVDRKQWDIVAAVAVGRRAGAEVIPEKLRAMERPSDRKHIDDFTTRV